jgi:membrane protein DedA with SNARE-associated domain
MAQWIIDFIEEHGYLAIVLLMLLENVFPPIPSEFIVPFGGFVSSQGELSLVGVVLAGTAGSLLGTLPWYWAGRRIGHHRLRAWARQHGRWVAVSPEDVDKANRWFEQHSGRAVFLGRLVPALRSVISAPAGVAAMPLPRFLLWSTAGSLLWVTALAAAGHALGGQYELVMRWMEPVSRVVLGMAVAAYVWRVWRFGRRR